MSCLGNKRLPDTHGWLFTTTLSNIRSRFTESDKANWLLTGTFRNRQGHTDKMVGEYWDHRWGVNTPIDIQFPCLNNSRLHTQTYCIHFCNTYLHLNFISRIHFKTKLCITLQLVIFSILYLNAIRRHFEWRLLERLIKGGWGKAANKLHLFYFFNNNFIHFIIHFWKFGLPYLGKATAATRAVLVVVLSATQSFTCMLGHSFRVSIIHQVWHGLLMLYKLYTRGLGSLATSQYTTFWLGKTLTNLSCAPDGVRTSGLSISSPTLY